MSTHKPAQRTYRNYRDQRNDQRQPSQQNIPNTYNNNNMPYSYIINQHPSNNINSTVNHPPNKHLHQNPNLHHNIDSSDHMDHIHSKQQSAQFLISHHQQQQHQHHHHHHQYNPYQRAHSQQYPPHHSHNNNAHYPLNNNNNINNKHKNNNVKHGQHHHSHSRSSYNSQRKTRNNNNNNNKSNNIGYHHRNRHGYNGYHQHQHQHQQQYQQQQQQQENNEYLSQYENYNQYHHARPSSNPPISSDILICIDNVGPELIQYLPASTAYYLIEVIEPYLTNQNNAKSDGVPIRRKSELLSKWHNSYTSWKRMNEYLNINDLLNRLYHFNNINEMNNALHSNLCIWDLTIKKSEIEQFFGSSITSRNVMIRSILSYIIMECFLMNKENIWFPVNSNNMLIKKELNLRDIHKFLLSKLQKIDDIKKFYNINPNLNETKQIATNLSDLLNEFKSRFERDNFGGDTLLYVQSWESDKFDGILSILSNKYRMDKNKSRIIKSHIYELGYRQRLDRPIFGFYIGEHKGYNPRTKGIELKFNPLITYSYFYDLKLLFLPEFIEDCVDKYFSFDVKWESDYTRGEQFKYYNLIGAKIKEQQQQNNNIYQQFKFVVWKGQYFDADHNLLGQYSG